MREIWQRLISLIPTNDLFEIVRKTKITPPGFTQKLLSIEKVELNRPKFASKLLEKTNEVNSKLGTVISNDEGYKNIREYRHLTKREILNVVAEGANPFWVVLSLISSNEHYEMGSLIYYSLDANGVFEKYSCQQKEEKQNRIAAEEAKTAEIKLTIDYSELKKKSEAQERRITKLESKIHEYETINQDSERRLKIASTQASEWESRALRLENELKKMQENNRELEERIKLKEFQMKQEATKHNHTINEKNAKITSLENDIKNISGELSHLKKSFFDLEKLYDQQTNNSIDEAVVDCDRIETYQTEAELTNAKLPLISTVYNAISQKSIALIGRDTKINRKIINGSNFDIDIFTEDQACNLDKKVQQIWVLKMDVPQDKVRLLQLQYQNKCVIIEDLIELRAMVGQSERRMA